MLSENERLAKHKKKRKQLAIAFLGGKCVNCGSTEELEFDHIDPATKEYSISSKLTIAYDSLLIELAKCQLLCYGCHKMKSSVEHGGGVQGKHKCNCHLCREKKLAYMREYNYNKR